MACQRLDEAIVRLRERVQAARDGGGVNHLAKMTHVFVPVSLLLREWGVGNHVINVLDDEAWEWHIDSGSGTESPAESESESDDEWLNMVTNGSIAC